MRRKGYISMNGSVIFPAFPGSVLVSAGSLAEILLLVTAVSADAFAASFAYGVGRIRIPFSSVTVITVVSAGMLLFSLLLGGVVRPFLPLGPAEGISFGILCLLGIIKLFDSTLKAFFRRHTTFRREWKVAGFELRFILNVYANPEEADSDRSHTLSPREAAPLAAALSLDGLAAGFGAGLTEINYPLTAVLSLLIGGGAVLLGAAAGRRAAEKLPFDLSWMGGALLIALAVIRLF